MCVSSVSERDFIASASGIVLQRMPQGREYFRQTFGRGRVEIAGAGDDRHVAVRAGESGRRCRRRWCKRRDASRRPSREHAAAGA